MTPDPIADNIEALLTRQRRAGLFAAKWEKIEPGQCCLCGYRSSETRALQAEIAMLRELVPDA